MTKKELLEKLKNTEDDAIISVWSEVSKDNDDLMDIPIL